MRNATLLPTKICVESNARVVSDERKELLSSRAIRENGAVILSSVSIRGLTSNLPRAPAIWERKTPPPLFAPRRRCRRCPPLFEQVGRPASHCIKTREEKKDIAN